MIISDGMAKRLEKKGYGYLVVGRDIDTKSLSKDEIGVIQRTKNQSDDYLNNIVKLPLVLTNDGNSELYHYLKERTVDSYSIYDMSASIPNTVAKAEPEDGEKWEPYEEEESVLDLERGI